MFHSNTRRDDNTMLKIYHLFFIFITKKRKNEPQKPNFIWWIYLIYQV